MMMGPEKQQRLESAVLEAPGAGATPSWSVPIATLRDLLAPWVPTRTVVFDSGLQVQADLHVANLFRAAIADPPLPQPNTSARVSMVRAALFTFVNAVPAGRRGQA